MIPADVSEGLGLDARKETGGGGSKRVGAEISRSVTMRGATRQGAKRRVWTGVELKSESVSLDYKYRS